MTNASLQRTWAFTLLRHSFCQLPSCNERVDQVLDAGLSSGQSYEVCRLDVNGKGMTAEEVLELWVFQTFDRQR